MYILISRTKQQLLHKLNVTHLFIDEAAQASEPATLVPITGLLAPNGHLILAGDPKQLGPVCISKEAKERGLGKYIINTYVITVGIMSKFKCILIILVFLTIGVRIRL